MIFPFNLLVVDYMSKIKILKANHNNEQFTAIRCWVVDYMSKIKILKANHNCFRTYNHNRIVVDYMSKIKILKANHNPMSSTSLSQSKSANEFQKSSS